MPYDKMIWTRTNDARDVHDCSCFFFAEQSPQCRVTLRCKIASGDSVGTVSVGIPVAPQWWELRKIVFSWTQVQFPFRVRSGRKLNITQSPIITVIGEAFFDIGHTPADHSNRRTDPFKATPHGRYIP
jgi:hypothetical protein